MKMHIYIPRLLLVILLVITGLIGCAGRTSFHEFANAGDTVAVPMGWKHKIDRDTIKVTISSDDDPAYVPVTYLFSDAEIRAITNFYVDPLASIVVSRETNQDLTPFARTYAQTTSIQFTGDDKDWWQSVVFVDLPNDLPVGLASILVDDSGLGDPVTESVTVKVNIVGDAGNSYSFDADVLGPMTKEMLDSLSRVDHNVVNFSGSSVPAAIQVDLVHDSGVGQAHVVNPVGYIKNAAWSDDGTNLKVILTPARDGMITTMSDFKFYVTGGITGLALAPIPDPVQAFDINGEPVVDPVTVSIE